MIWQIAQVVDSSDDSLHIHIAATDHCQRCMRGEGCGAGVFSRLFARRDTRLSVPAVPGVQVGDWVRLGVAPQALALASAAHYGLALGGLLAGAWLGQALAPEGLEDIFALAGGLAGLAFFALFAGQFLPFRLNPVVERLSCSESDANSTFNSS